MRNFPGWGPLLFVFGLVMASSLTIDLTDEMFEKEFDAFVQTNHKVYQTSQERQMRFNNFKTVLAMILKHNHKEDHGQGRGYRLGLMPWADQTAEERQRRFVPSSYFQSTDPQFAPSPIPGWFKNKADDIASLPAQVDWRTRGAVTVIKSQGQCGSSPDLGTIVAVEGCLAIHKRQLISLSTQQMVDCAPNQEGCDGAAYAPLFKYALNGSCTGKSYPYKGVQGTCNRTCEKMTGIFKAYHAVPKGQEATGMLAAVASGPVAAAINADADGFEYYVSGIFNTTANKCPPSEMNHGIAVVGYGTQSQYETNQPFWILKNSWGPGWGEEGFMRIARGNDVCGIADSIFFVTP